MLGLSGINLLYGHGDFGREATYQTALCLWGYGLGLLPAVFVLLLSPAFFAKKDFKTPMIGAIASVVFNILLTSLFVFVFQWGAFSIAVATSTAAWFNYLFLSYQLTKRVDAPLLDKTTGSLFSRQGAVA